MNTSIDQRVREIVLEHTSLNVVTQLNLVNPEIYDKDTIIVKCVQVYGDRAAEIVGVSPDFIGLNSLQYGIQ